MFISPIGVLKIQSELEDYKKLCDAFNYSPAKKEFDEIVNYILLQQGGMSSGSMCENKTNSVLDYVYESFVIELNEASKSDDSVVGNWISYLFKKGKVVSSLLQRPGRRDRFDRDRACGLLRG